MSGLFEKIAEQTLAALERPYPHALVHVLNADEDAGTPRQLHPAFHGSFDWHSAVHGHWCLARLVRLCPGAGFVARARARLEASLSAEALAVERKYLEAPGRAGFENPYGLAWILELASELERATTREAEAWRSALAPLEALASKRLLDGWARIPVPVRGGEHSQAAFSMGLAWDRLQGAGKGVERDALALLARRFYGADRDAPLRYEPSATDFLSPILAEADVMRRVLAPSEFAEWLTGFLPDLESDAAWAWLTPVTAVDQADGKLSHWDGLNASRAWMLEAVAAALPPGARRDRLAEAGRRHREAALAACLSEHFASAHWLGTFALYLLTSPSASASAFDLSSDRADESS